MSVFIITTGLVFWRILVCSERVSVILTKDEGVWTYPKGPSRLVS